MGLQLGRDSTVSPSLQLKEKLRKTRAYYPLQSHLSVFKHSESSVQMQGPQPESWSCIKQKARPAGSSKPSCFPSSWCRCENTPRNLTCLQFVTSMSLPQTEMCWGFCFTSHQGEVIFEIFHLKYFFLKCMWHIFLIGLNKIDISHACKVNYTCIYWNKIYFFLKKFCLESLNV